MLHGWVSRSRWALLRVLALSSLGCSGPEIIQCDGDKADCACDSDEDCRVTTCKPYIVESTSDCPADTPHFCDDFGVASQAGVDAYRTSWETYCSEQLNECKRFALIALPATCLALDSTPECRRGRCIAVLPEAE